VQHDARRMDERLVQVVTVQGEPMTGRTPVRVRVIVKMISEERVRSWAGGHGKF
jgi:hypothetical protein